MTSLPAHTFMTAVSIHIQTVIASILSQQETDGPVARRPRIWMRRAADRMHLRVVVSGRARYLGYGLQADSSRKAISACESFCCGFDQRGVRLVSFAVYWTFAPKCTSSSQPSGQDRDDQSPASCSLTCAHESGLNTLSHDEVKAMAATLGVKPTEVEMETRPGGRMSRSER
jgi:hypothetical protein